MWVFALEPFDEIGQLGCDGTRLAAILARLGRQRRSRRCGSVWEGLSHRKAFGSLHRNFLPASKIISLEASQP